MRTSRSVIRITLACEVAVALCMFSAPSCVVGQQNHCESAIQQIYGDQGSANAKAFVKQLQAVVKANDVRRVAMMMQYPLQVHGVRIGPIRNAVEFQKQYSKILTAKTKEEVLSEKDECLFANGDGITIDDGVMWFDQNRQGSFKVKAITVD